MPPGVRRLVAAVPYAFCPLSGLCFSLSLLSHSLSRASWCLRRVPKPGSFTSCVARCSSSCGGDSRCASARNARTKSVWCTTSFSSRYERVEIMLDPRNCLAGNLFLYVLHSNQSIKCEPANLGGGTGKCLGASEVLRQVLARAPRSHRRDAVPP
ncbi:hypothetical protein GGI35DRAFT_123145 [Trichoderma velutinum]